MFSVNMYTPLKESLSTFSIYLSPRQKTLSPKQPLKEIKEFYNKALKEFQLSIKKSRSSALLMKEKITK